MLHIECLLIVSWLQIDHLAKSRAVKPTPPWATAAAAVWPGGGMDWDGDTLKDYTKPRQTIQRLQKDYTKT